MPSDKGAFTDPAVDVKPAAGKQTAVLAGGCFWCTEAVFEVPAKTSYGQLLKIFFSVAHDPTTLNRQGSDRGPQYCSAIFYVNEQQKRVAEGYIKQINDTHVLRNSIVTQVVDHGHSRERALAALESIRRG